MRSRFDREGVMTVLHVVIGTSIVGVIENLQAGDIISLTVKLAYDQRRRTFRLCAEKVETISNATVITM